MTTTHSNQAANIFQKFGGPHQLYKAIRDRVGGISLTTVHRWAYPKDRKGTDGFIPARYHQIVLNAGVELGLDIGPADFFETTTSKEKTDV